MVWCFRVVVGILVFSLLGFGEGRLAAAKPGYAVPASTPAGTSGWERKRIAPLPKTADLDAVSFVFTGNLVCAQGFRFVRLRCWDAASGAQKFAYEVSAPGAGKSVESGGYALGADGVLLAYHVGTELWLREIDLAQGRERRSQNLKLDDDASVHISRFRPYGSSLLYAIRKKVGKTWATAFRKVNATTGKVEYEIGADFELDGWDFAADVLFLGSSASKGTAVMGFDLATGKKLFSTPFGQAFLHGIAAGPHEVFVELDEKLLRLDAHSGQTKGSVAVAKQGNRGPRVQGDHVYVCASGLAAFSLTLSPAGRILLPNEWIIDCTLNGDYATFHNNQTFHVVDLKSMTLLATSRIREDRHVSALGWFDGQGLPVVEATPGEDGGLQLTRLLRAPAQTLQVTGLPSGAVVLEDGEPAPATLTLGKHHLDVFRTGYLPLGVELSVSDAASARVDLKAARFEVAKPSAPPENDTLPKELELTDLAKGRRSAQAMTYGSNGSFADRGRRIAFDGREGLFARSFRTGRDEWNVPAAQVKADTGFASDGRLGGTDLFAVLPNARLALLATRAHADAMLLAYDLDTGKLRWKARTDLVSPPSASEYYLEAASEYGGLVWYHSSVALYGRDLRDGHLVYSFQPAYGEGLWGPSLFSGERAYLIFRKELLVVDLNRRAITARAPVTERGYLVFGPSASSVLFYDQDDVRSFSTTGTPGARSPKLGGDLTHAPLVVKPEAIYACGDTKNTFTALDPKSLRPLWSYKHSGGESPCPDVFSLHQIAATDSHTTVIVDRKNGKQLATGSDLVPDSRYLNRDAAGLCFLQRSRSECFDR